MATAINLSQAAGQSFDNLFALWTAGNDQLKTQLALFARDVLPIFPDADPVGRPVGNWAIFIASLAQQMPSFGITIPPLRVPFEQLVTSADYVYRICWLGAGATPASPAISVSQRTLLLAAYNARF